MVRVTRLVATVAVATALLLSPGPVAAAGNPGCSSHGFLSTVTFAPGFWTPGTHTIHWAWSIYGEGHGTFVVDTKAPLYPGLVWVFPYMDTGLVSGPPWAFVPAVNPAQRTLFYDEYFDVYGIDDIVTIRNSTQEWVSIDGAAPLPTHFSGIGSVCETGGPYQITSTWTRNHGPVLH